MFMETYNSMYFENYGDCIIYEAIYLDITCLDYTRVAKEIFMFYSTSQKICYLIVTISIIIILWASKIIVITW